MCGFKSLAIALGVVLFVVGGRIASAQPLLREGDVDADGRAETDAEELRRWELARQKAGLEEEQRLKLQAELLRLQGQQIEAERLEKERSERMMRYALFAAVAVIAVTLLIAFVRSRSTGDEQGERDASASR